jgi:hypothetical protein
MMQNQYSLYITDEAAPNQVLQVKVLIKTPILLSLSCIPDEQFCKGDLS